MPFKLRWKKLECSRRFYNKNRLELREKGRIYREKNREKMAARARQRYHQNPRTDLQKQKSREWCRRWRKNNPEKANAGNQKWRAQNPEKVKEAKRRDRLKNFEAIKARGRQYYLAHKERLKHRTRRYYRLNREKVLARQKISGKAYTLANRLRLREYHIRYYAKNLEKLRAKARRYNRSHSAEKNEWHKLQYRTRPAFNIKAKVRHRIREAIKSADRGVRKANSTIELLGCSFAELKLHIEKQFKPGMSWEAVMDARIELDHIRPCASFNLVDPEQQKLCFHYTNLQPLWATDNRSKRATYVC